MQTVTTYVTIGKSKEITAYTFKADDFIRIEKDRLILKSDERRLRIVDEHIKETIDRLNAL